MAEIALDHIEKIYSGGQAAVSDLSLGIADGEMMVLVGPSGCGKSTVLRLVAGLEAATAGRVLIGGWDVTSLPPQDRDIAMVFQTYALYPHKTVRDNLGFGLRMRRAEREVILRRVAEVSKALGIERLLDRKPAQLSGGERQRVALGRAMVREPQAFLLDEPLSNLDARLRVETRAELARLHRRLRATMIYVTHDQEEAMTLGERIAVLKEGRLQQVAPPLEVYHRPANVFVAGFIGSPAMNVLRCSLRREKDKLWLENDFLRLEIGEEADIQARQKEVLLGIRPKDLELTGVEAGNGRALVDIVEPRGSETVVHLEVGRETRLTAVVEPEALVRSGDRIGLRFPSARLHLFDAETGERQSPAPSIADG